MRIIEVKLDDETEKRIQELADVHAGGCIEEMAEDLLLKVVNENSWVEKHQT